uniref:Uncharacterized protein n=1 Tax=Arundo donax TaxID=35708 RepID=A0A0A9B9F6_ARUDO
MPPPAASRPGPSGCPSSGLATPTPEPEVESPIPFLSEWYSLDTDPWKHAREYEKARDREYLGEPPEPEPPTVTTTRFEPSDESLLRGPRRGADGHMRIYGMKVTEWRTATAMGRKTEYASIRVDEAASITAGRN